MGTVNVTLGEDTRLNLILGQQDENEVREVVFDFSGWYTTYGSGTISLSVQRSKDQWPYEVELTVDNTNHTATWTITDTDTGYAGVGMIQITYTVGTAKKKSVVYRFTVYKSLGATGNVITPVQLQTWMDEVDQELADVKADLQDLIDSGGGGMSAEFKQALHNIFEKVAFIDGNGVDYLNALDNAMNPPKNLSSITCVYTQSGAVYTTDSLDVLKDDLVVTAHYDNGTSQTVTAYTLSGTLEEGTSTITVSYNNKTTTFDVIVTEAPPEALYSWDFTDSLVDSVQGVTALISRNTPQDSNGITFADNQLYVCLPNVYARNRTYEIDISSLAQVSPNNYGRIWGVNSNSNTSSGGSCYIISGTKKGGDIVYASGGWDTTPIVPVSTDPDGSYYSGSTLGIYIDEDGYLWAYKDGEYLGKSGKTIPTSHDGQSVYIGGSTGDFLNASVYTGYRIYEGNIYS